MRTFVMLLLLSPFVLCAMDVASLPLTAQGVLSDSLVHPQTLLRAQCLGICYEGAANQAMIGYSVTPQMLAAAQRDTLNGCDRLTMQTDDGTVVQWCFCGGLWVSPLEAHTQRWSTRDSRYFRFICEDEDALSQRGVASMDNFVESAGQMLGLTDDDLTLLAREKIRYYLCADAESVLRLTGYHTRGVYILAENAIVSHLPCHYHESTHLLVNFRLRDAPLYTHPFFQEGIANYLGGRAGKTGELVVGLGAFLLQSGMMSPQDVLDGARFSAADASFTYPTAAAMHQQFLRLRTMDEYLTLYRRYSSGDPAIRNTEVDDFAWRGRAAPVWPETVRLPVDAGEYELAEGEDFTVTPLDDGWTRVACRPGWLLFTTDDAPPVRSTLFREILPGRDYSGETYALRVTPDEIALYDLHTATMTAAYIAAFTQEMTAVPQVGEMLVFEVRGDLWPSGAAVWTD